MVSVVADVGARKIALPQPAMFGFPKDLAHIFICRSFFETFTYEHSLIYLFTQGKLAWQALSAHESAPLPAIMQRCHRRADVPIPSSTA